MDFEGGTVVVCMCETVKVSNTLVVVGELREGHEGVGVRKFHRVDEDSNDGVCCVVLCCHGAKESRSGVCCVGMVRQ